MLAKTPLKKEWVRVAAFYAVDLAYLVTFLRIKNKRNISLHFKL